MNRVQHEFRSNLTCVLTQPGNQPKPGDQTIIIGKQFMKH